MLWKGVIAKLRADCRPSHGPSYEGYGLIWDSETCDDTRKYLKFIVNFFPTQHRDQILRTSRAIKGNKSYVWIVLNVFIWWFTMWNRSRLDREIQIKKFFAHCTCKILLGEEVKGIENSFSEGNFNVFSWTVNDFKLLLINLAPPCRFVYVRKCSGPMSCKLPNIVCSLKF